MPSYDDYDDGLFSQAIVWFAALERDRNGKPLYSAEAQEFKGRRVSKVSRVSAYERGTKGQGPEVLAEGYVLILGKPTFGVGDGYEDRVVVKGESGLPPILAISTTVDEDGTTFTKVTYGSANG